MGRQPICMMRANMKYNDLITRKKFFHLRSKDFFSPHFLRLDEYVGI